MAHFSFLNEGGGLNLALNCFKSTVNIKSKKLFYCKRAVANPAEPPL